MTKMVFLLWRVTSSYIEIAIRFSVISLNLSNLLAEYVITTYVTHQKMFHFVAILNFDALYDKYAKKFNILL